VTACLLVGALAVEAAAMMAHKSAIDIGGVVILTVMFAGYLVAALAVTTYRSSVPSHALLAGLAGGFAAAIGWLVVVVLVPPIPPDTRLAVAFIASSMVVTGLLDWWRGGRAGGLDAALIAGTFGALVILNLLTALSVLGPANLIPPLMPPSIPLADQIANSRIEITDHYLWLLLLGWFVALVQAIAARAGATPRPANPPEIATSG
jgi:hypothetical protein